MDGELVPSGMTQAYRAALGVGTHPTIAFHFFSSSLLPGKRKLKEGVELSSATDCLLQGGQTR